ncbi:MAG: hypothetical protein ACYDHW_16145, partial [Syntrophorhabdaceae bacterium]
KVSDEDFRKKMKSGNVRFFSKAHLVYYEIYRKMVGNIPERRGPEKQCSGCPAGIPDHGNHCRICGWAEGMDYE